MTSASGGILPSYQRLANGGAPASLFSRRSFRPREKYLILIVFLTFLIVCFGAYFFLPDFGAGGVAVDSVYRVYRHMQKAGPDLLIPAPPRRSFGDSFNDESYSSHHPNALPMPLGHEAAGNLDVHLIEDRLKLQAKIDEEYQQQKTLEKPEIGGDSRVRTSSLSSSVVVQQRNEQVFQTVPPAPAIKLPLIVAGEDKDTIARERRDKVKEIKIFHSFCRFYPFFPFLFFSIFFFLFL
ncbi:mannosyl-oligosaccharide alpha-1,2-mannosidase IA-like isoform X2 [Vespa mandarinia]|uniref:mannosyl-oligosaccharide alpha-1,2-mannosidase IA-like isoform X2 n=1 Tax=Vespa mandarinia TaxID=7446 RepID=UPI001607E795|nr:mannosyl-oligosaccharide alpha-1,2-mannosidase IA-like isoform X2 [Vespa mandarinia]